MLNSALAAVDNLPDRLAQARQFCFAAMSWMTLLAMDLLNSSFAPATFEYSSAAAA